MHFTHWNIDQTIPSVTNGNGTVLSRSQVTTEITTELVIHKVLADESEKTSGR